jgi:alkanesulfonate monooxygenase SsuD/methylene tetrahydromethanopterin reductase-like flavin-dependent oxidoreductase (luciferase family)
MGAGRDPNQIAKALFLTVLIEPNPDRALELANDYCLAIYGMPFEAVRTIQAWLVGSESYVSDGIRRYVEAGAQQLVVRVGSLTPEPQLDRFARTILRP